MCTRPIAASPDDVLRTPMNAQVNLLATYVEKILEETDAPLLIGAYSLGGLVAANYLCRPRSVSGMAADLSGRVVVTSLLGTPIYAPYEWIRFTRKSTKEKVVVIVTPAGYNRTKLFERYPNDILNVYGNRDRLAPELYASLEELSVKARASDRLFEEPVDATHMRLTRHERTIELVASCVERLARHVPPLPKRPSRRIPPL